MQPSRQVPHREGTLRHDRQRLLLSLLGLLWRLGLLNARPLSLLLLRLLLRLWVREGVPVVALLVQRAVIRRPSLPLPFLRWLLLAVIRGLLMAVVLVVVVISITRVLMCLLLPLVVSLLLLMGGALQLWHQRDGAGKRRGCSLQHNVALVNRRSRHSGLPLSCRQA